MSDFFNRKVGITYEDHFSRMHQWSLNECDQDGKVVLEHLVPWRWSLEFTCDSLSVIRMVSNKSLFFTDGGERNEPKRSIRVNGKLSSTGGEWDDALEYSFLGTDRRIEVFNLEIIQTEDGESEGCSLVAAPMFEYESPKDFSKLVSDDEFWISVRLKAEKVEEIARLSDERILDKVVVSIQAVDGFFSKWRPTIYTSFIKILPNRFDIDGLDPHKQKPEPVGKVGEFSLVYKSKNHDLDREIDASQEVANTEDIENSASVQREWIGSLISNSISQISSANRSILAPLWAIFLILLFLLFK
jgi:hypothetical protein